MSWTKDDVPALLERRKNLQIMIAGNKAGYPATMREHGEIISDHDKDLANHEANLAEVEETLAQLGVDLDT